MIASDPLRVGISACLLGDEVRWDGGHKRDRFITGALARIARFVPVCPEMEIGLGAPREPIHLVSDGKRLRLLGRDSGADHTEAMARFSEEKARELAALDLDGYLFKNNSPSCGMERVVVHRSKTATRDGRGAFAAVLMARLPRLPVEEEGRLSDPALRENFVERLFAHRRVRRLFAGPWRRADLVRFHAAEKLLLLAHDRPRYDQLGRLVARVADLPRAEVASRYTDLYLQALATIPGAPQHVNVLQHIAGYFKKLLSDGDRAELAQLIDDYRRGRVPLIAPLTLLRHHVRAQGIDYLALQQYLAPHPSELLQRSND